MKEFIKRILFKPVLTSTDFLILFSGYQTAGSLYGYSFWLYLLFLVVGLVSVMGMGNVSEKYYEVVENEFEKENK